MKRFYFIMSFFIIVVLTITGCTQNQEKTIVKDRADAEEFIIAGSGTNLPIAGKLVDCYNRKYGTKIQMPGSIGSGGGIRAVSEGAISLGMVSRPLKDSEKRAGVKEVPYARVALVIAVNQDVPEDNITYRELVDIFAGRKVSWQNGKNIVVLSREDGDSSNMVLEKSVPGFKKVLADSYRERRWQVYFTDAEEARAIAKLSSSIGFSDSGAITAQKLKIKALQVDGTDPVIDNVRNGRYTLYKDLYFVYKEPLSDRGKKFLDFVLSGEGERVITANGGIQLKG